MRGFTLIELLISITLLGLVLFLLYGAFFQISNLSIQIKSSLNSREQLRLLMKIVLDDLQNIQYLERFAESGRDKIQPSETGLIVERILGPRNSDTGEHEEISILNFHTAIKSRFYNELNEKDPEIHEVGYSLEKNSDTKNWDFYRREDFYIDNNLREGGKIQILSHNVTKFDLELLESETELAEGGFREKWTKYWNSDEKECSKQKVAGNYCLPRAIKLTIAIKDDDKKTILDSQVINICLPPCNPEVFD